MRASGVGVHLFCCLILLMIFSSFLEVLTVSSVLPLFEVLFGAKDNSLAQLRFFNSLPDDVDFRKYILFAFAIIVVISSFIRFVNVYFQIKISYFIAKSISKKIFENVIKLPFEKNINRSSSEFINMVMIKANLVTRQVIIPAIMVVSNLFLVVSIMIGLFFINKFMLVIVLSLCVVSYALILWFSRKKTKLNSENISIFSDKTTHRAQESFRALKEIVLLNQFDYHIDYFRESDAAWKDAQSSSQIIGAFPRFFIEGLALLAFTGALAILINDDIENNIRIIGVVAVFGVGFQKMAPAIQAIYSALISIRTGLFTVNDVVEYLSYEPHCGLQVNQSVKIYEGVTLENFSCVVNGSETFRALSCTLNQGSFVSIMGESGVGKTTFMNVFSGLQTNYVGEIRIDGQNINNINKSEWTNSIAYVDQQPFIYNGTIKYNITLNNDTFDHDQLEKIIKVTQLSDLLDDKGLNFVTGEDGKLLSGGQRQRICIARALYLDRPVLILDEATTGLGSSLQRVVLRNIRENFPQKLVLIITHDKDVSEICDQIIKLEKN